MEYGDGYGYSDIKKKIIVPSEKNSFIFFLLLLILFALVEKFSGFPHTEFSLTKRQYFQSLQKVNGER